MESIRAALKRRGYAVTDGIKPVEETIAARAGVTKTSVTKRGRPRIGDRQSASGGNGRPNPLVHL